MDALVAVAGEAVPACGSVAGGYRVAPMAAPDSLMRIGPAMLRALRMMRDAPVRIPDLVESLGQTSSFLSYNFLLLMDAGAVERIEHGWRDVQWRITPNGIAVLHVAERWHANPRRKERARKARLRDRR